MVEDGYDALGFHGDAPERFAKIASRSLSGFGAARSKLDGTGLLLYEGHVPHAAVFMRDADIQTGWVRVSGHDWTTVEALNGMEDMPPIRVVSSVFDGDGLGAISASTEGGSRWRDRSAWMEHFAGADLVVTFGQDAEQFAGRSLPNSCTVFVNAKETLEEDLRPQLARRMAPALDLDIAAACLGVDGTTPAATLLRIGTDHIAPGIVEIGRLTGLPFELACLPSKTRRTLGMLYREAKPFRYLFPEKTTRVESDAEVGGGTHLDPVTGHHDWVAVLDFKSMYPSIIVAHDLCFTNFALDAVEPVVTECPIEESGALFARHLNAHPGSLLPRILRMLAEKRALLKQRKDLPHREKAVKLLMNVSWGAMGQKAETPLRLKPLAATITALGRNLLRSAVNLVEGTLPQGAGVVYGVTDSIMIRTGCSSLADAFGLAQRAADAVNAKLPAPIRIEVRHVSSKFILLAKNRYVSLDHGSCDDVEGTAMTVGTIDVARDRQIFVRRCYREVASRLLRDGPEAAWQWLRQDWRESVKGLANLPEELSTPDKLETHLISHLRSLLLPVLPRTGEHEFNRTISAVLVHRKRPLDDPSTLSALRAKRRALRKAEDV